MKNIFKILILVSVLQSCSNSNKEKDRLIGNWSIMNGPSEFEFYKDSLIINEMGMNYVNSWDVDGSKLFLKNIKGLDSLGIKEPIFDYKLSDNNDTLFIKKESDSIFRFPIYRIKGGYDYLLKYLELTIDLPSKNDLISNEKNGIGLDIFVGFRNGKLIAKTGSYKTQSLEEIKYETSAFLVSQKTELDSTNFQYNLIIDKNVNSAKIDSIKEILKSTGYKRMFRVYTNDKVDYEKTDWKTELNWYGVYE